MVMLKKVLSGNTGGWIKCVWCHMHGDSKPGYELYKSVFHEHVPGLACDDPRAKHVNYLFCSERHRQYFRNSHIEMDRLPAGYRSVI